MLTQSYWSCNKTIYLKRKQTEIPCWLINKYLRKALLQRLIPAPRSFAFTTNTFYTTLTHCAVPSGYNGRFPIQQPLIICYKDREISPRRLSSPDKDEDVHGTVSRCVESRGCLQHPDFSNPALCLTRAIRVGSRGLGHSVEWRHFQCQLSPCFLSKWSCSGGPCFKGTFKFNCLKQRRELGFHFLALLCATAQQSYCRHAGVHRRPSVRPSSVRP